MTLRAILDSLDGLPADVAKEYKDNGDGKFVLDVDGVQELPQAKALKVALDRIRTEKKALTDKLAEVETKLADLPEGWDAEQFAADMDELEQLRAKTKRKPGDPPDDEAGARVKQLYEQRIAALEKKYGDEKIALQKEVETLTKQIEKLVADEGLTRALVAAGVEKKLMPGATALLRRNVKVKKDGEEFIGYIETELGESSIEEYVSTWAQGDEGQIYIAKPKGGNGSGGDQSKLGPENPWDTQGGKVKPNLFKQQQMIQANPDKARSMATAAGFTPNW